MLLLRSTVRLNRNASRRCRRHCIGVSEVAANPSLRRPQTRGNEDSVVQQILACRTLGRGGFQREIVSSANRHLRQLRGVAETPSLGGLVSKRFASSSAEKAVGAEEAPTKKTKKKQVGLMAWLWDQVLHVWHGFRLLGVNIRVTIRLRNEMRQGQKLTRRERQLLQTTTQDLIRLVPFSAFIILPGGELLLPIAIAMFPNLMPSTFESSDAARRKQIMGNLETGIARRRLFEHMALNVMVQDNWQASFSSVDVFRACATGNPVNEAEIRNFVPYFADGGTLALSKLPFHVLSDLSVLIGIVSRRRIRLESAFLPQQWLEVRLRYKLDREFQKREEDDGYLNDLADMTMKELEQECARRKMRFLGSEEVLRAQLQQWVSLSLDPDVPDHLLYFLFPCGTDPKVYMQCLSNDEREHILGLKKFQATPMYIFLRKVTQQAEAQSQVGIQTSIMSDDIDDVRERIKEVKEEARATATEFEELRDALKGFSDEELLENYDQLVASREQASLDAEGEVGIDVAALAGMLSQKGGGTLSFSWIGRCLDEFDMDKTNIISRDEFKAMLSRIRMAK